ncbi:hypothetical protein GDO81_009575 [Engystomops pustulosus]|uniref:Olfactory receptor n=1 Tax=Engystomops pustulosus TaxID=76066 RepID=A0AAV7BSA0_ENGPU|nr:hypothetical protein GDO81_009575 [Engystomops pustulosus]
MILYNASIVFNLSNYKRVEEFILLGLTSNRDIQILLFVIFLSVYVISLIGNIIIVFLSTINSRLHTPMYYFLRNLSFLDIWYTTRGTECYLLLSMAYDRYVAICSPLHYTNIMHPTLCLQMAIGSWVFGLVDSLVHTVFAMQLPYCGPNVINHFFCEVPSVLEMACTDTYVNKTLIFWFAMLVVIGPFCLILITYGNIIFSILKIKTSSGKRKAFSTCASHIIVVSLFYGTIMFIYMKPGSNHEADQNKMATLFYSVITPMLNPLIYTLRNKDMKGAFVDLTRKKIRSDK